MSEKQWNVSVGLVRSSKKNEELLSSAEERELIRTLAHLDPRPADCRFKNSGSLTSVPPVTVYFSAGATNHFEAQTVADGLMKKLEEILPPLDLAISWFHVTEVGS